MTPHTLSGLALAACLVLPSLALGGGDTAPLSEKEQIHRDLLDLGRQIRSGKTQDPAALRQLEQSYRELSAKLGGDDPAALLDTPRLQTTGGVLESTAPAPPGSTATTTNFANNTSTPILDNQSNLSTITVSGVDPFLWDIDLNTFITHTWCSDLDITLTSPAGTVVKIATDLGGSNDDVFNGSLFDDQQVDNPNDWVYANGVTAGPFTPEGALAFRGEDPNGIWTLDVADDATQDTGQFTWSIDVTTLDVAPSPTTTNFANNTPVPIVDNQSNLSTITVSGGPGFITDIDLNTFITHTWCSDLDITLTSPAGTVVMILHDLGGSNDDVFNGTLIDDGQFDTPVDWVYSNGVTAGPFTPMAALDLFAGEDANGVWTLDVADGATQDTGQFTWSLDISGVGACGTVKTYCTAKATLNGCVPTIGSIGTPTKSGGPGTFDITLSGTRPNKPHIFFYSINTSRAAIDFQSSPGRPGFLCMQPPVRRTPVVGTSNTGECTSGTSKDFGAIMSTAGFISAGDVIRGEWWGRDTPGNSSLSDAIEFTICP